MKSSLKKTLAAFTVISAGFLPGAVSAAQDFHLKRLNQSPPWKIKLWNNIRD